MRVLITPQFNAAMLQLDQASRAEVSNMFNLVSTMKKEQLVGSPIFTRLESGSGDMYTLRTSSTRIFCSFDSSGALLFLDVKPAKFPSVGQTKSSSETTLFTPQGDPRAYIATDDDRTIYSWDGRPLAYLEGDHIYSFDGRHLGWFEDGVVWDHMGRRVGFIASKCPTFRKFEPFKAFKAFKPFKNFRNFPPFKPFKSTQNSKQDLISFLEGRK